MFFATALNGVTATPLITGTFPAIVWKNDCAPTATPPVAISGSDLFARNWSAQVVPCSSVVVKQVSSFSGWPSTPPSSLLM